MIKIIELNPERLHECSSCSSHTSSRPQEMEDIMGGKQVHRMFEVTIMRSNTGISFRLCPECLLQMKTLCEHL